MIRITIIFLLILIKSVIVIQFLFFIFNEYNGSDEHGNLVLENNEQTQIKAMLAWSSALTEKDYNNTYWHLIAGESSGPPQYFDLYIQRLSEIFAQKSASVNFIMIGACDGTHDLTIKRYLSFPHWNGMFIEPVSVNFAALEEFLKSNNVYRRTFALRAAATDICKSPTIKIERPLFEEKAKTEGKEVPHWLRRQIGGILKEGKSKVRADWTIEEVKCVTAKDALSQWVQQTNFPLRPHILKLDVEGHDYEVLMGFLQETEHVSNLPLLISFEAKSLGEVKFRLAQERMISLGYAVARYGNDGFALLRGDKCF